MRRELSERLALEPNAPHGVISMLANDKIEVAGPILEHSTVLEDMDLLEVIRRQGQDHLRAISARETVSSQVVDALVSKGDNKVLVTLVNNSGASISRNSMDRIVARAEGNEELHQPLSIARACRPNCSTRCSGSCPRRCDSTSCSPPRRSTPRPSTGYGRTPRRP